MLFSCYIVTAAKPGVRRDEADIALLLLHILGGDGRGIIGGGGSDGDVGGILVVFQVGKARCARDEADRAGLLLHIQAARGFQFANCLRL